jgi:hypothetical protein
VNAPFLDECTLRIRDKLIHKWPKLNCEHLGNDLRDRMNQAYGPKVGDLLGPSFLGNKKMLAEFSQ